MEAAVLPFATNRDLCACGCGLPTNIKRGRPNRYIKGHSARGKARSAEHARKISIALKERPQSFEQRKCVSRGIRKADPIISPFVPETLLHWNRNMKRWCCGWYVPGRSTGRRLVHVTHAAAVYRHYFGDIPKGYAVHHKDGKHSEISDDRPDNLMLLPRNWNWQIVPFMARNFGVSEEDVTRCYIKAYEKYKPSVVIFRGLCAALVSEYPAAA